MALNETKSRLEKLILQHTRSRLPDEFSMLPLKSLRKICSSLSLNSSGTRTQLCSTLSNYFQTPQGRLHAYNTLEKSTLTLLFSDSDPISTFILNHKSSIPDPSALTLPSSSEKLQKTKLALRCICIKGSYPYIVCETCSTKQHWACMGRNSGMSHYECILCQMITWDPSQEVRDVLVMPYSLPREDPKVIVKKVFRSFEVDETVMEKLQSKKERFELQLRCLKLDGAGYNNVWPNAGAVVLNGVVIFEPHKVLMLGELPLDLSKEIVIGENKISIIKYNDTQYYAAGVFLVRKLGFEETVIKLRQNSLERSEIEGKEFVVNNYSENNWRISVKCKLKNRMIWEPVRGVQCRHIECFDMANWIETQGKIRKNRWACPLCGIRVAKLCRDLYMEEVFCFAKAVPSVEFVEFCKDGSYELRTSAKIKAKNESFQVKISENDIVYLIN